jgi:hypothetical protein
VLGVLALLVDGTLCSPCIELLTDLSAHEVEAAVMRLTAVLTVRDVAGVCDGCSRTTEVYQLKRRVS